MSCAKTVLQIEPCTMQIIKKFESAEKANKAMGYPKNTVAQACRRRDGTRITSCSHGYFWSYSENYDKAYFEQFKGINVIDSGRLPRSGERKPLKTGFTREEIDLASAARSRPILCIETQKRYNSLKEAAIAYGVSESTIYRWLRRHSKTSTNHKWVYIEG